jgi:drug/metabolite transporter (DMT)-like permease
MTIALNSTTERQDMRHTKIVAVCLALFTVLITGFGSELEKRAIRQVIASNHPKVGATRYEMAAAEDKQEKKIDIIRDNFKMFLIFGGAFGGAVVCVLLRRAWAVNITEVTSSMMAAYFTVSLLSAIFCVPWLLKHYLTSEPEECFMASFVFAAASWVGWEIAAACGSRLKKAAENRGWLGVKDEILGNSRDVTSVPSKPVPTPVMPGSEKPV